MKTNKMPITIAIMVLSWLIAIFSLVIGGYLITYESKDITSLITGCFILFGGLTFAGIIRMFGNMGQISYDIKAFLMEDLRYKTDEICKDLKSIDQIARSINQDIKEQLQLNLQTICTDISSINQEAKSIKEGVKEQLQSTQNRLQLLKDSLKQLEGETKTVNQNISQIKAFFGKIEGHLDLKR